MEIALGFLIVVATIATAGVLFTLWLVWSVVRGIFRAVMPRKKRKPRRLVGPQPCTNADCRGDNPEHARFCRRCGRPLPALLRLVDARAA